jgi:hypothetical protein
VGLSGVARVQRHAYYARDCAGEVEVHTAQNVVLQATDAVARLDTQRMQSVRKPDAAIPRLREGQHPVFRDDRDVVAVQLCGLPHEARHLHRCPLHLEVAVLLNRSHDL